MQEVEARLGSQGTGLPRLPVRRNFMSADLKEDCGGWGSLKAFFWTVLMFRLLIQFEGINSTSSLHSWNTKPNAAPRYPGSVANMPPPPPPQAVSPTCLPLLRQSHQHASPSSGSLTNMPPPPQAVSPTCLPPSSRQSHQHASPSSGSLTNMPPPPPPGSLTNMPPPPQAVSPTCLPLLRQSHQHASPSSGSLTNMPPPPQAVSPTCLPRPLLRQSHQHASHSPAIT